MPVAFDTHKLITRLIQGQMPQAQAEAIAAALKEALDAPTLQLATTTDLARNTSPPSSFKSKTPSRQVQSSAVTAIGIMMSAPIGPSTISPSSACARSRRFPVALS